MSDTAAPPPIDMAAYWNDVAGHTWTELADLMDQELAELGLAAMDALAPVAGETIVDVGCGCGQTSLQLAGRVGPKGSVLGIDISRPMLALAKARAEAAGAAQVRFVEADAQTYGFEAGSADGLFSRFGWMFFPDPPAAFANLRRALKPGGRVGFVCWRTLPENPWMTVPMAAVLKHLPPPPPPAPGAPGPFAFADPERIRSVLGEAGFSDVQPRAIDLSMGGFSVDDALRMALRIGPVGAMLRDNPEVAPKVVDDIREALGAHAIGGKVALPGAAWVVTARSP